MLRNATLDYTKLLLAFMVVGIHAGFLYDVNSMAAYLTNQGIFRVAVPLFLLINGFYFYDVVYNKKALKWFKRIICLYAFWMLFYAYFWFKPESLSLYEIIKVMRHIIMGHHHLWYISGTIFAAALLYLIRNMHLSILICSIILTFSTGVMIQYLGNYHVFEGHYIDDLFNKDWVHRNFLFLAFPFVCVGFLINKFHIHTTVPIRMIVISSVIGVMMLLIESYVNFSSSIQDGGYDNFISLLIVAPSLFILALKSKSKGETKKIALLSTSIYLIHPVILSVLRLLFELNQTPLMFVTIILSLILSIIIIAIHKKIKFIL